MCILNIVLISSTIYTEYIPVLRNQNNQHCSAMRTRAIMSFMRDLYRTFFKLSNCRTFKVLWSFREIIVILLLSLHKKKNDDNLPMLIVLGIIRWKKGGKPMKTSTTIKKKSSRNEKGGKNGRGRSSGRRWQSDRRSANWKRPRGENNHGRCSRRCNRRPRYWSRVVN